MKIRKLLKTCKLIWKMRSRINDLQTETVALIDTNEKLKTDKLQLQSLLLEKGQERDKEMNELLDIKAEYYKIIRHINLNNDPSSFGDAIELNRLIAKITDYLRHIKYKRGTNEDIDELINLTVRNPKILTISHYYDDQDRIIWYCKCE